MSTATIAARATNLDHAHVASARPWRVSAHAALLVWTALFAAYGARVAIDAGPAHLFQLTFFLGGLVLILGLSWSLPFLGALLTASLSAAAWVFVDATPTNNWLGLAGLAVAIVLMRTWIAERREYGTRHLSHRFARG